MYMNISILNIYMYIFVYDPQHENSHLVSLKKVAGFVFLGKAMEALRGYNFKGLGWSAFFRKM